MSLLKSVWHLIRAHHWWNYKLPLALMAAYAYASKENISFNTIIFPSLIILFLGFIAATYASLVNDFMDYEQDLFSGKETQLMKIKRSNHWIVFATSLILSIYAGYLIRAYPISLLCFATIILNFSLYSIPPFRLKEKGIWGVISIALGEHFLPALLAILIIKEATHSQSSTVWVFFMLLWAFTFGIRGILWHQLMDEKTDQLAGCNTALASNEKTKLLKIGRFIIFPLELISFLYLLTSSASYLAWFFFIFYLLLELMRYKFMSANIMILAPLPNARFFLFEYYQIFFPLSLLLASLWTTPSAIILIIAFVLLFFSPVFQVYHHCQHFWMTKASWIYVLRLSITSNKFYQGIHNFFK